MLVASGQRPPPAPLLSGGLGRNLIPTSFMLPPPPYFLRQAPRDRESPRVYRGDQRMLICQCPYYGVTAQAL